MGVRRSITYTWIAGNPTSFTVPAGVTAVDFDIQGARGGGSRSSGNYGRGGRVTGRRSATPGEVWHIYVGKAGSDTNIDVAYNGYGGWNGGGNGGDDADTGRLVHGAGGGGASDIRVGGKALANRVVVAGGGGGTNGIWQSGGGRQGGHGGGLTGGDGALDTNTTRAPARGGTQTAGGAGGTPRDTANAATGAGGAGSLGVGGDGKAVNWYGNAPGGGGGGGYYGGGGGNDMYGPSDGGGYYYDGGPGAGGSSYTDSACTNVVHTQGVNVGHGVVTLSWEEASNTKTHEFGYTGAQTTFVVPADVTSLTCDVQGAQGGNGYDGEALGGRVRCVLPVTPGETLYLNVGEKGRTDGTGTPTFGGGGAGGGYGATAPTYGRGNSGGGASDIRRGGTALSNRVVVAGAGGAHGSNSGSGQPAGHGGGLEGGSAGGALAQPGGTQTAGGGNGSLGQGGAGSASADAGGGGGGAGYYGGGGAGAQSIGGSGGGGSSYTAPDCSEVAHTQGYRVGNGFIALSYIDPAAPKAGPDRSGVVT